MTSPTIGCGDGPEDNYDLRTRAQRIIDGHEGTRQEHVELARALVRMLPEDSGRLVEMVRAVIADVDADDNGHPTCRECGDTYTLADHAEPTALCHYCAQHYVTVFAETLERMLGIDESKKP